MTGQNTIDSTLGALMIEAKSNRTKRSLEVINEICTELLKANNPKFTVATIGRISAERGGPSAQAIRNSTGKAYRELIDAYKNLASQNDQRSGTSEKYEWVNDIADPNIRWLVHEMAAENRELTGKLNIAKRELAKGGYAITLQNPIPVEDSSSKSLPRPSLTESEIKALKHAIDKNSLAVFGFDFGERGEVVRSNDGKQLFKVGFRKAIEKLLAIGIE